MGIILPPLIDNSKFDNHYDFLNYVYSVFEKDFKDRNNPVLFCGHKIKIFPEILNCNRVMPNGCNNPKYSCLECFYKEKEETFNHLTTEKFSSRIRTPGKFEVERTKRFSWIKSIIESYYLNHSEILYWTEEEIGYTKIKLWLKTKKFVVIIKKRNNNYFLLTAYYLTWGSYIRKLQNEYDDYLSR